MKNSVKGLMHSREESGILDWRPVPSATRRLQQEGGNVDSSKGTIWKGWDDGCIGQVFVCATGFGGAEVASGTRDTLQKLKDETKRQPLPRELIASKDLQLQFSGPLVLRLRKMSEECPVSQEGCSRGGAGASGMTVEHLRPLLDFVRDQQLF